MENKLCPCCNSTQTVDFLTYYGLPEILFPVDIEVKDDIMLYDLSLMSCESCGHIFQKEISLTLNERIYKDLYRFYPFATSETFLEPYRTPFENMFEYVFSGQIKNNKLLEIGCSSLETMQFFYKKGFICTGVDPSSNSLDTEGIKIIEGIYEEIQFDELFDVVVTRFNLEHIINLDLFMGKLSLDLKDGGMVFVQVPNIQDFIQKGNLCIGAHEHTNYFSKESLIALFSRYKFEIKIFGDTKMPSLIACFTKNSADEVSFESNKSKFLLQNMINQSTLSIQELITKHKRICFYGAGLQLIWLLYCSGVNFNGKEIIMIDDNKIVQGRYMPRFALPLVPFHIELLENEPLILLSLNQIYHSRIIDKIFSHAKYNPSVAVFNGIEWEIFDKETINRGRFG